jgi:hypothetical protein
MAYDLGSADPSARGVQSSSPGKLSSAARIRRITSRLAQGISQRELARQHQHTASPLILLRRAMTPPSLGDIPF